MNGTATVPNAINMKKIMDKRLFFANPPNSPNMRVPVLLSINSITKNKPTTLIP